jgi:uncharacterized protein YjbI with pentapeptide repeats
MRLVKPMHVGMLSRCFEYQRRCQYTVTTLIGFSFDGSVRLMSEMAIWKMIAAELGDSLVDESMPKSRAEFFVRGRAFPPGGAAATCPVSVEIGGLAKTLYVVGDRYWVDGVPTEPVPFTEMDLTWARSFGGADYARNTAGKGSTPVVVDGHNVHPLPNIEEPGRLITSPRDRREPAGFLPWGLDWPQRRENGGGTYDDRWLREEYPGFPSDIDWSMFNVAPADQQQEAPFRGNETFRCTNMHPQKAVVEGRLPGIAPRCFVTFSDDPNAHQRDRKPGPLIEVPLRATTVWLLPHIEMGILVFHGTQQVSEDDATDLHEILLAAENLGEPRELSHYERVMRDARAETPEAMLRYVSGSDLVPPGCEGVPEIDGEIAALKPEGLLAAAQFRRAEEEHAAARQRLIDAGMDPEIAGAPPAPAKQGTVDDLPGLLKQASELKDQREAEAEAEAILLKEQARELCEKHGLDYDSLFVEQPGPPKFSAAERLADIEETLADARSLGCPIPELEAQVADPAFRAQIEAGEANLKEAYRLGAHTNPKLAPRREGEEAARQRKELLDLVGARHSAAGRDFTGIDLAGQDISGADLRGVFMECANLAGANLTDCDLSGSVLANASLEGANLTGAKLRDANLGRANLRGAYAERPPDLLHAILELADLTGARIPGVVFDESMLRECIFDGADLSSTSAKKTVFIRCSMRGTIIAGSNMKDASFIEMDASDLIATGASLEGMTLFDVRCDGAKLDRGMLANFRACGKTSLTNADLSESMLERSNFRAIDLSGARLVRSDVSGGDLSEARFAGADLTELVGRASLFIRTDFTEAKMERADLMNALLSKANLTGADLTDANLYGADLARARSDGGTKLDGAIKLKMRVFPVRAPSLIRSTISSARSSWAIRSVNRTTRRSRCRPRSSPAGRSRSASSRARCSARRSASRCSSSATSRTSI